MNKGPGPKTTSFFGGQGQGTYKKVFLAVHGQEHPDVAKSLMGIGNVLD